MSEFYEWSFNESTGGIWTIRYDKNFRKIYEGIDYKTNNPMTFVRTLEDFNNNFDLYYE